jgi:acetyl-CoA C-acetyltransferase
MTEVVISSALRSAIGKRGGSFSSIHATELLGAVLAATVTQSGVDPAMVGQVMGGCISQVGMQGFNVTRTAWLTAGLPKSVPASTLDSQCGSSQQAANVAAELIRGGNLGVAVACGVEVMSQVPMGSSLGRNVGKSISRAYYRNYEYTSQFEAAERIADKWHITRQMADEYALESQARAARARDEERFVSQIIPIEVVGTDEDSRTLETTHSVSVDECPRETSLEGLAALNPVARQNGVHTAGSSSQIADAAAAMVMADREQAEALGLPVRARILDTVIVGTDPVLMLTGPIEATHRLLKKNGMTMKDIDVIENNEAFASVVLAWSLEHQPDPDRLNPNGGAIALGHALGSTGVVLLTKALHELERSDQSLALITMCCGGGLATGTLVERV